MDPETFYDDEFVDEWDLTPEDFEPLERPWWRRPLLAMVAVVTVLGLAAIPLVNLFGSDTPVAANGLEICGFDYCVVQEAVREAGLGDEMSRLSNTFLSDEAAAALALELADYLDEPPVTLEVVNVLEGDLEGQYDPATRHIIIERPARAWTVAHEVAHAAALGHGDDFQRTLIELARALRGNQSTP